MLFKYQFAYSYIDSAQEELGRVILQESSAEVGNGELSRVGENVDLWADLEGNLYSISFVHLPHLAFLGRLNKMKSLSRTIVNMGEICVVKCFVKIICKWWTGSAVLPTSQVRLRMGWGPWPCSSLLSLFTATGKLFLPTACLPNWEDLKIMSLIGLPQVILYWKLQDNARP